MSNRHFSYLFVDCVWLLYIVSLFSLILMTLILSKLGSWCLLLICFLCINSSMPEVRVVLKEVQRSFAEYDCYLALNFVYRVPNLDFKPSQFTFLYRNKLRSGFNTRCGCISISA